METSGSVQVVSLFCSCQAIETKPEQSRRYGPPVAESSQPPPSEYCTPWSTHSWARDIAWDRVTGPPGAALFPRVPVEDEVS